MVMEFRSALTRGFCWLKITGTRAKREKLHYTARSGPDIPTLWIIGAIRWLTASKLINETKTANLFDIATGRRRVNIEIRPVDHRSDPIRNTFHFTLLGTTGD